MRVVGFLVVMGYEWWSFDGGSFVSGGCDVVIVTDFEVVAAERWWCRRLLGDGGGG